MFAEAYAAPTHNLGLLPGHAEDILRTVNYPSGGGEDSGGINWNQIISQGFAFGTTFLNDKYAKDASRSTGTYNPTGQQAAPAYQPIATTTNTAAVGGSLSLDRLVQSGLGFVQKNLLVVVLGVTFLLAFRRDPNRARR